MKLQNKQTPNKLGEIVSYDRKNGRITVKTDQCIEWCYYSLAELNAEWEDAPEEPKGVYYINTQGEVQFWDSSSRFACPDDWTKEKEIGNYFSSREEAEKACEKLKAWKRLRDKGFRFDKVTGCWIEFTLKSATSDEDYEQGQEDLHLLFGGEE